MEFTDFTLREDVISYLWKKYFRTLSSVGRASG